MKAKELLCHTTPRIELLCSLSAPYGTIADIGCDHAYVSIHLARMGRSVIASDISEGPLSKARKNICAFGLNEKIDLRLCGGLSGLKSGEAEEIIIAGMGGNIISDILSEGKAIAAESKVLFLQPMTASEVLRRFLYESGFVLKNEYLIREGRRIYTVIETAFENIKTNYSDFDCYISPAIAKNIDVPIYKDYVQKKYNEFKKIIKGLEKSETKKDLLSYYISIANETEKLLIKGGNNCEN